MSNLVPEHILTLSPYTPGRRAEEVESELGVRNAVKLASNENPVGPSPRVVEAIQRAATGLHRYPDVQVNLLREALAQHWQIDPRSFVFGNGSNELIDVVIHTFCTLGSTDEVMIGHPSFAYYHLRFAVAHINPRPVPLRENLFWSCDDLLASVTPQTKMMMISNPNNPTGAHLAKSDVERLVREVPQHVVLVMDEAYGEYCDDHWVSAVKYLGSTSEQKRENLIVLRTFSKAYGLAGLGVGYAMTTPKLAKYMDRVRRAFSVSTLAQAAAKAALEDTGYLAEVVSANRMERSRVAEELMQLGYVVAPSQANFLLFKPSMNAKQLNQALLREGIIVREMQAPIEDYLRVSIGTPSDNTAFLSALKKIAGVAQAAE